MRVKQGDTEYYDIPVTRSAPPVDLTTAQSLTWSAKRLDNDEVLLFKSIGDGITVLDEGNALLVLEPEDTALITVPLRYEVDLVEADGRTSSPDSGIVELERNH